MKSLRTLLLGTAALLLAAGANAQTPSGTAPAGAPAKPRPYSSSDARVYITVAEAIQFQLKASERLRGKYRDGDPAMLSFAGKITKECIELFTPGVDAAMAHGVEGKKIPQDMTKNDKTALAKLGTIKDEKKWALAFFEHYAKEAKKNAADVEKIAKGAQDADLKAYAEKAAGVIKTQADTIEAKFKELKAAK
jgi:hypothetical protein